MPVELRPYQDTAFWNVRMAMRQFRRVLLVSPTGSGKTVIFVHVAERVWAAQKRVYLAAHRIEIVEQIAERLRSENVRFGVMAPGYRESDWPVQVAMIQTMANRLDRLPQPDLFVIDEAHHAVAGRYQTIIKRWPGVHILGVTATPQRLDGRGLGDCFDTIVLCPTVKELVADGYLCAFDYFAPPVVAELSGLRVERGDFAIAQMVAALDRSVVTGDAEQNYRRIGNGRPAIAFCSSVAHAEHVAEEFRSKGWKAASVDGSMAPALRKSRIAAIGNGELNVLTSCDLISEGTDIPVVAGALLLRKTMSLSLFLQMCGRVLRPKPDGSRAFMLDHVSAITEHGLPDATRKWSLDGKKRTGVRPPPTRNCPKCYLTFAPAKICPGCGYEFPAAANAMLGSLLAIPAELQAVTGGWIETGPLNDVLRSATTWSQIDAIRKARGYKPNWTNVMYDFKNRQNPGHTPRAFKRRWA
jgi:DNA repair protein RadD